MKLEKYKWVSKAKNLMINTVIYTWLLDKVNVRNLMTV